MEVKILSQKNEIIGTKKMPKQFEEPVREDLIGRAVLAIQSHKRQPYGADPRAGKKASAIISKRRRDYKGCYGRGASRTPRKTLSKRGSQMHWVGAFAPMTVGGRRAHPPKAEKIWWKKINNKERKKAIRAALAASINKEIAKKRNRFIPKDYPFILGTDFEGIESTKKVKEALIAIGFGEELERSAEKKIRAGKGKARGRKYKKKKGMLLVVGSDCNLEKSARNIPGIDVAKINSINTELLAPGGIPGRLTLYTIEAIKKLEKENLFI